MPEPGVSRDKRISEEGLKRLEKQLQSGNISVMVLQQWVRRYGQPAREMIKKYRRWSDDFDQDKDTGAGDR